MTILLKFFDAPSRWDQLGQLSAVGLAFSLPISTSLTSIFAALLIIAWLFGPNSHLKREILLYHPLMAWLYPLILLAFIGTTYSIAEKHAIYSSIADSLRLMLIPLLLYFYQSPKIRQVALWGFACAMMITLFFAFLKVHADFPIGLKYTAGAVFKSHIKTSFFMAIAAFFLALQLKQSGRWRWPLVGLIAVMIYYLLFMNMGRIGYITLVICLLWLAWQRWRLTGMVWATAALVALIIGAYCTSNIFAQRLNVLAQDMDYYHANRLIESSLGSRLQFAKSSLELIAAQPLLGWGTGSFGAAYAKLHEGNDTLLTDNPHNEYLRMGVEYGLVGMALLILLFYQQWRLSINFNDEMRVYWQGVLIAFILGCFLNSWLKDSSEGYFYCIMTAICFASLAPQRQPATKAVLT